MTEMNDDTPSCCEGSSESEIIWSANCANCHRSVRFVPETANGFYVMPSRLYCMKCFAEAYIQVYRKPKKLGEEAVAADIASRPEPPGAATWANELKK